MPTSTCGTEFYLLPKPGEEHGEVVGPECVSEMNTDQSGMRIVSYGQYVSLPRPSHRHVQAPCTRSCAADPI